MNIGIDMMGGDFAPAEAVTGIQQYLERTGLAHLFLIGDEMQIAPLLPQSLFSSVTIVHAPLVYSGLQPLAKRFKKGLQPSISVGFKLLASGTINAFISAGDTGAILVSALTNLTPFERVLRPAIATIIPKENGTRGLLLDVGLNADCKPEYLNQFAVLGSAYAKTMLNIKAPRVALLNIGEEEGKGNRLTQAAYRLLQQNEKINFVGNIEGRDVFSCKADVLVCDGFTGNIVLKLSESLFNIAVQKGIKNPYFDLFDFQGHGGVPVLGLSKPVIIGHGISKRDAFLNMILLAEKMIEKDIVHKLSAELQN